MNILKKLYRFLGSVYLAIILIASLALLVTIGTFLESSTGSHLYAAQYTYSSWLFASLLWLFFINILVSALHRWPFRVRHIPFLITHLGLLMIIGGTLIKNAFGVQGSMGLIEGGSSQEIFLAHTHVLQIEKKNSDSKAYYPLKDSSPFTLLPKASSFPEVNVKLINYFPHSQEKYESWIKNDILYVKGFGPIPVKEFQHHLIGAAKKVFLHNKRLEAWTLLAFKTEDAASISREVFVEDCDLLFKNASTNELLHKEPLKAALEKPFSFNNISIQTTLNWNYSNKNGFKDPHLIVDFAFPEGNHESVRLPLDGPNALQNINLTSSYLGNLPITVRISQKPTILFAIDPSLNTHYFVFESFGKVYNQIYTQGQFNELSVYDRGYGGYFVQAKVPLSADRQTKENALLNKLTNHLREGMQAQVGLAPPLQLLAQACEAAGEDFCSCCVEFLQLWNNNHSWILSKDVFLSERLKKVLTHLDWSQAPERDYKGAQWLTALFSNMGSQPEPFLRGLKQQGWPLPLHIETKELGTLLQAITMQVFSLGDQDLYPQDSTHTNAQLLSAYLRAYSIHLQNILPPTEEASELDSEITIETSLTRIHQPQKPQTKLEDNMPLAYFEISTERQSEKAALAYDRYGLGLKWPVLQGQYLMRFQPEFKQIPYRIRLRDARQINYANSSQPYSYESDILIYNQAGDFIDEATISMNRVYETWNGYRFYLASLSPAQESEAQRVQIVVNYDPAKYFLTYPGGIIVTIGIILLFWMRPYKKRG